MTDIALAEAETAYRRLAALYSRAMDRNEPALLREILVDDAVIDSPAGRSTGLELIVTFPAMLREMFHMTQHAVHQQTLVLTGDDAAEGESYSTASHVSLPVEGEGQTALVWALRYQDRLVRRDGGWRFAERKLVLDWSETRPVTVGG